MKSYRNYKDGMAGINMFFKCIFQWWNKTSFRQGPSGCCWILNWFPQKRIALEQHWLHHYDKVDTFECSLSVFSTVLAQYSIVGPQGFSYVPQSFSLGSACPLLTYHSLLHLDPHMQDYLITRYISYPGLCTCVDVLLLVNWNLFLSQRPLCGYWSLHIHISG